MKKLLGFTLLAINITALIFLWNVALIVLLVIVDFIWLVFKLRSMPVSATSNNDISEKSGCMLTDIEYYYMHGNIYNKDK